MKWTVQLQGKDQLNENSKAVYDLQNILKIWRHNLVETKTIGKNILSRHIQRMKYLLPSDIYYFKRFLKRKGKHFIRTKMSLHEEGTTVMYLVNETTNSESKNAHGLSALSITVSKPASCIYSQHTLIF